MSKMETSKLGWHSSIKELLTYPDEFFEKYKVFQVFIGSPRSLQVPSFTDLEIFMRRHKDVDVIVHMPYVVSLCKHPGEKIFIATLGYTIACAKEFDRIGVKYIVTHIGGRPDTMSVNESATYIWNFCQKFLWATDGCKIKLCLENDSGSNKGTKMGYLKVLSAVIRKCNSERIRMTFDSEHAYAAGFDITDSNNISQYKDLIEVVHWNAVPENVVSGGHLDRHSITSFYDSKVNPMAVYRELYDGKRPFIFEVNSLEFVRSNFQYLKEVNNV